ncbi:hypothetical protein [Devosia sp.]|uniref:hypothetical protein n=1 Tax=Devosia sp. TaxID=1871048 RepID=UPI00292F2A05|nr:hypothetical protein [Devosia sp.]
MFKTTALALLAGIITATAIVPSHAAVLNNPRKPVASTSEDDCAYQLNYMPRVTRAHIDAIQDREVYLIPVCEDGLIGRNDDYGWLFTSGNVGTLRLPIANNAALMSALTAEGYDHQDVVSLRFGGDGSIALYVHQRTLR